MHLLLDMDGTLIDSSIGIHHSFSVACEALSLNPVDYDSFTHFIGPPVYKIVNSLFPDLGEDHFQDFCSTFRNSYDNESFLRFSWYPGVIETLRDLSTTLDMDISIVTNKPTKPALQIVETAGLTSCFSRIIGIDYKCCVNNGQPFLSKSEAIHYALNTHSKSTPFNAYVGDTIGDKEACLNSGVQFIAALYGFHQWSEEDLPPLRIDEFRDVLAYLPLIFP